MSPYSDTVTVEFALHLARNLKYGPVAKPEDPVPSVDEAIDLIHEERYHCRCNWITGTRAEEVLRLHRGEDVTLS